MFLPKKWHLTYFVPIDGHSIYINFDIQTKFEVDHTKIGHSILQKLTKVDISQNPFWQVSFTIKPTSPTFFD